MDFLLLADYVRWTLRYDDYSRPLQAHFILRAVYSVFCYYPPVPCAALLPRGLLNAVMSLELASIAVFGI
jgi:hypothetical protein